MPGDVGRPQKIDKYDASLTVRLRTSELSKFKKLCEKAKRKPADILREFIKGKIKEDNTDAISRFFETDAIQPIVSALTYRYNHETEKIECYGVTEDGGDILIDVHDPTHIEEDIGHMYEAYQKYLSNVKPNERRAPKKVYRI